MQKTVLIVMAAGMGNRYGGLKQLDPVGPSGEVILDYSVYDAVRAGFDRAVFVVKKDFEDEFKARIGSRFEDKLEVEYVCQDAGDLPAGYCVPKGRTKPWGTGHAVLSCRGLVSGPFAVVNADDFYGGETFRILHDALLAPREAGGPYSFCMVGFRVENTLTENGSVSRGVCRTGPDGCLSSLAERTKILRRDGKIMFTEDGEGWTEIPEGTTVSMNCWGFTSELFGELGERFRRFLDIHREDLRSCEYFLPFVVDELIREGRAKVKVFRTSEKWYGVTYRADREPLVSALRKMTEEGKYPADLWAP